MTYTGYFDSLSRTALEGWAYTPERPHESVYVDIYDYDRLVATIPTGEFRADLLALGFGHGRHGFRFPVPRSWADGQLHLIRVQIAGTRTVLAPGQIWFPYSPLVHRRMLVAAHFLKGSGIEIGALHSPLPAYEIAAVKQIRYVDRMTVQDLRLQYPELSGHNLVQVDVIDDGEKLGTIANRSLDFIICSHMLEHCQNPIGTIRNHMAKLKKGGALFIVIPDKRFTFDAGRELTSYAHLLRDDKEGSAWSRETHYREWAFHVQQLGDETAIRQSVQHLTALDYSIHFHVWDETSFHDFLLRTNERLGGAFETAYCALSQQYEVIAVLVKR